MQLACGTDFDFAIFVALYGFAFFHSFYRLGHLFSTNGLLLLSAATKTVFISQLIKVLLWQPADKYLYSPSTTIELLALGMLLTIPISSVVMRTKTDRASYFPKEKNPEILNRFAYACLALGAVGLVYGISRKSTFSSMPTAKGFASYFLMAPLLGIVSSTAAQIIRTQRKKSANLLVLACVAQQLLIGTALTSKQGVFDAFLAYALTCWAFAFKPRVSHWLTWIGTLSFGLLFVYPFLYGSRKLGQMTGDFSLSSLYSLAVENASLSDPTKLIEKQVEAESMEGNFSSYYGFHMFILERLSLIKPADFLVNTVESKGTVGLSYLTDSVNLLPGALSDSGPTVNPENFLGQWTGTINELDEDTSIAFTPIAEAFAYGGWEMVFLIYGGLLLLYFMANHYFFGNIRSNIWAVFAVCLGHQAFAETGPQWMFFYVIRLVPLLLVLRWVLNLVAKDAQLKQQKAQHKLRNNHVNP